MSKKVKKNMTIKQVEENLQSAEESLEFDENMVVGRPPPRGIRSSNCETGGIPPTQILQMLEDDTPLQLIKNVVTRTKEISKFLAIPSSSLASSPGGDEGSGTDTDAEELAKRLSEKVDAICTKYTRSVDKAAKFLSKLFPDDEGLGLSCESDFFRTYLKYGMNAGTNAEGGSGVISILQAVFSVGAMAGKVDNPTLGIQMIVSHSSAAEIFLDGDQFGKAKAVANQSNQSKKLETQHQEKYSGIKTQLLKLWRSLVTAFTKVSEIRGTPNDKKILENSVPYLLQMYTATMSEPDQEIFYILREYAGKQLKIPIESMPLFGPKSLEPLANPNKASNPLFVHSSRANTVLGLINDRQAFQTAMEYKEQPPSPEGTNPNHYDVRFLLPQLCHALDAKNICDAVKVITHGWIYLIVRGLSFEDEVMRNLSFLAYKRLIQNFQLPKNGFKMQDIKVWLHFLLSVRKGMQSMDRCKISNLLSVWMVAAWECIRQPAHPMYQRLTTFLFAKPVIVLSVLPDFLPFYNAIDGNRATREWILNILSHGLQSREDWRVAQKQPTITSLCSSFIVEKVLVQREILKILHGGATIQEVAQEMVDKHSLLIWLANVSLNKKQAYGKELYDLFKTLRKNCPDNECRQIIFQYVSNVHDWTGNESI